MNRQEFKSLLIEWNNAEDVDILSEGVKDYLQKAAMTLMGLAVSSGVVNAKPIENLEQHKIKSSVTQEIYGKDKVDVRIDMMIGEVLSLIQEEDKALFERTVLKPFITLAKKLLSDKSNLNQFDEPTDEFYNTLSELLNNQVLVFAKSEAPKSHKSKVHNKKYIEASHSVFSKEDLKAYTNAVKSGDTRKQQEIIDRYKGK